MTGERSFPAGGGGPSYGCEKPHWRGGRIHRLLWRGRTRRYCEQGAWRLGVPKKPLRAESSSPGGLRPRTNRSYPEGSRLLLRTSTVRANLAAAVMQGRPNKTPERETKRASASGRPRDRAIPVKTFRNGGDVEKGTAALRGKGNLRGKRRDPWHRVNAPPTAVAAPVLSGQDARPRKRVLAWFASRWRNHLLKRAEKPHSIIPGPQGPGRPCYEADNSALPRRIASGSRQPNAAPNAGTGKRAWRTPTPDGSLCGRETVQGPLLCTRPGCAEISRPRLAPAFRAGAGAASTARLGASSKVRPPSCGAEPLGSHPRGAFRSIDMMPYLKTARGGRIPAAALTPERPAEATLRRSVRCGLPRRGAAARRGCGRWSPNAVLPIRLPPAECRILLHRLGCSFLSRGGFPLGRSSGFANRT